MSWRMSGLKSWLLQRVSAVYLAGFLVYFLFAMMASPPRSYADWHGWMSSSAMSLATALFFVALLAHAWVGIRDVMLDYIKPFSLRLALLVLLAVGLVVMALWAIRILLTAGGV
jgi:succinate dehydrogenase / fumarate reductase membrane anchor subunit